MKSGVGQVSPIPVLTWDFRSEFEDSKVETASPKKPKKN